jgi:hypothetical protein
MPNPLSSKKDSPLFADLPAWIDLGAPLPQDVWAILWGDWLACDGRIVGVHPLPRQVEGGWIVGYEVEEDRPVESLYAVA